MHTTLAKEGDFVTVWNATGNQAVCVRQGPDFIEISLPEAEVGKCPEFRGVAPQCVYVEGNFDRSRWSKSEYFGRERGPLDMSDIEAELRRDPPPSGIVLVDEAILRGQTNSLSSVSVPLAALAQLRQSWEAERVNATEANRALVIAHRNEVLLAREVDVLRCELERIREGMRKLIDPKPVLPLGGGEDYTSPRR